MMKYRVTIRCYRSEQTSALDPIGHVVLYKQRSVTKSQPRPLDRILLSGLVFIDPFVWECVRVLESTDCSL